LSFTLVAAKGGANHAEVHLVHRRIQLAAKERAGQFIFELLVFEIGV
jgi:hypothetical protein